MTSIVVRRFIYVLICLANIAISMNVAGIAAAIPVISADLNLSDILVSKIIPYYMIPYGLGALMYAPLTRYFSYCKVLCCSLALYGAACWVCALSTDLSLLLMARIVMGITASATIPLGLMMIGDFFAKEYRGRLVGIFFSCSFFASLIGLLLLASFDWRWLFYCPAILGVLMSVCFFGCIVFRHDRSHCGEVNYFSVLSQTHIFRVFLFIFILSALYHGVHKWFGVYLNRVYQMDKQMVSLFFIIGAIAGLGGQLLGGVISDKKGRLVACYLGILGLAISVMLLIGHYPLIMLAVVMALISLFWTIGHNGISTVLTDFTDHNRSAIASLNSSIRFISGGIGFYLSQFFVEKNFGLTFFVIGVLILVLSLTIKKMMPRKV